MPVTRANLKVSREYHNQVAFSNTRFFVTIITGLLLATAVIVVGETLDLKALSFSSVVVVFVFGKIAMRIADVKERPHKHLQRLLVENLAQKELDYAKYR